MKIVKCKLYKFEELAEEVRKSIVDEERWNVGYATMGAYNVDYNATLNEFEKRMGIKVSYTVDYCSYHFSARFISEEPLMGGNHKDLYEDDITGKYLRRYLNNEFFPYVLDEKMYYLYKAGYDSKRQRWNKRRYSKIFCKKWDEAPLTGMCYDVEIMKPIMDRMNKPIPKDYSLRDLVDDVLQNFFESWHREYEYWCDNDDAIEEQLEIIYEDQLFFEDGRKFSGIYECEDVA